MIKTKRYTVRLDGGKSIQVDVPQRELCASCRTPGVTFDENYDVVAIEHDPTCPELFISPEQAVSVLSERWA